MPRCFPSTNTTDSSRDSKGGVELSRCCPSDGVADAVERMVMAKSVGRCSRKPDRRRTTSSADTDDDAVDDDDGSEGISISFAGCVGSKIRDLGIPPIETGRTEFFKPLLLDTT